MADDDALTSEDMKPVLLAAYEATLPEMRALREESIGWIEHDVTRIASLAITYFPKIESLFPEFYQFGPAFHDDWVRDLVRYAHAALHAYSVYRDNPEPDGSLPHLVKRAGALRTLLVMDCLDLVERELLSDRWYKDFSGGVGAQSIACDLLVLRSLLREARAKRQLQLASTLHDLDEAEILAETILRRWADPRNSEPLIWEPADLHLRAFTLLDRAYQEARRAVVFLRWGKEDDHEYAPEPYERIRVLERWRVAYRRIDQPDENDRRRAHLLAATLTSLTHRKPIES